MEISEQISLITGVLVILVAGMYMFTFRLRSKDDRKRL